jgi:hypothetical protein
MSRGRWCRWIVPYKGSVRCLTTAKGDATAHSIINHNTSTMNSPMARSLYTTGMGAGFLFMEPRI